MFVKLTIDFIKISYIPSGMLRLEVLAWALLVGLGFGAGVVI